VTPEELGFKTVNELERLQPFGAANPCPTFILRDCRLQTIKPTKNPEHVQFSVKGQTTLYGIGFRMGQAFEGFAPGDSADLFVETSIDKWNGQFRAKLFLRDIERPD